MMSRRRDDRQRSNRNVLKATGIVAGVVASVPVLTAVSVTVLDGVMHRGRKQRRAPHPGTFHAELEDSNLSIYTSGAELYDDMIQAIESARKSVYIQTYIWKADEAGQRFLDALNEAAERGVEVFVLYDGMANLVVPRSFYRQFSERVHVYRLPVVGKRFWTGPLRHTGFNHSKIMVVDDLVGFAGGYNIGTLYADQWRDTHVREVGAGVWGMRHAIAQLWNATHDPEDQIDWVAPHVWNPEVKVHANLPVQLVYPIRNMYLTAIARAQDHIWITTPYFVPDQQILRALIAAAGRGVDVRVMVPKASNHVVSDWVSRGFYGQLLDEGITILLYAASMIHAKVATIDGEWSTVGTANIDRLSLSYNYETNVEITDPRFAAELEKIYVADSEHCEVLSSPEWRDRHLMARVVETALVPLRPLL